MKHDELNAIVNRFSASLRLLALRYDSSPDDIVQEAFLRLLNSSTPIADPGPWLFRVTRNLAMDAQRRQRRTKQREKLVARPIAFEQAADGDGPAAGEVTVALEKLDDETHLIVVAHLWAELTFEQIAFESGLSASTAHRRYQRGLKQLRQTLEQSCTLMK
ncbi:RNA polymerase sigma factor [Stratiformator vulcanicus]|uniref:RNA polymerase sigma factor n=1 Tax=Stratiformator vulcanicus TaxID=2527980 RepID=A0A517R177_9PLAN|nr:sigma-70 family RNA polymerase sigma factor [Stratiformator vulcanicus]QDT37647.1 RNA polymerase sigma factor [Stratiformator vulcanicus]